MKKKPSRTTLTRKADRLFSLAVRARDGRCVACGSTAFLQCAHGFSRRYHRTRWDFDNAWTLCRSCHTYYTHRDDAWKMWMENQLGLDAFRALRLRALDTLGPKPDLERIIAQLLDQPTEADARAVRAEDL